MSLIEDIQQAMQMEVPMDRPISSNPDAWTIPTTIQNI